MTTLSLPVLSAPSIPSFDGLKTLLTSKGNTKLEKTRKSEKVIIGSLSLRPSHKVTDANGKVLLNTCPWATKGCSDVCVLEKAGCNVYSNVKRQRDLKSEFLAYQPDAFVAILKQDLKRLIVMRDNLAKKTKKKKQRIFVRLNTASDIQWEKYPDIFSEFPEIEFYDYTKGIHRLNAKLPKNYHLTYSWNEDSNAGKVQDLLENGFNVAMVVSAKYWHGKMEEIPATLPIGGESYRVVDGDKHDIRHPDWDGKGAIVALRSKGGQHNLAKGIKSGFIVQI